MPIKCNKYIIVLSPCVVHCFQKWAAGILSMFYTLWLMSCHLGYLRLYPILRYSHHLVVVAMLSRMKKKKKHLPESENFRITGSLMSCAEKRPQRMVPGLRWALHLFIWLATAASAFLLLALPYNEILSETSINGNQIQ